MRFFWPISCQIATYTIRKKDAARTRIWVCEGHYMGLNLGFVSGINRKSHPYPNAARPGPGRFNNREADLFPAGLALQDLRVSLRTGAAAGDLSDL